MPKRKTDDSSPEAQKRFIIAETLSPIVAAPTQTSSPVSPGLSAISSIKRTLQNATGCRAYVYEQIILQVISSLPKHGSDRNLRATALGFQRDVISILGDEISHDKIGSRTQDLFDALESIFETKPVDYLVNKFVLGLLISLVSKVPSPAYLNKITRFIASIVESVVEIHTAASRFAWLRSCMSTPKSPDEIAIIMKYRNMIDLLKPDEATRGLFDIATRLVHHHATIHSIDMSNQVKQKALSLASSIFQDLYQNVPDARVMIVTELLDNSLSSIGQSVYSQQLETFMDSDAAAKSLFDAKYTAQRDEIVQMVVAKIQARLGAAYGTSDELSGAFYRTFRALRVLFFLAPLNEIQNLIKFLKGLKSSAQPAAKSALLVVLLASLQGLEINYGKNFDSAQTKRQIEANQPLILSVLGQLRDILDKTTSPPIKALIYQSFSQVHGDSKPAESVNSFFKSKIENVIVKGRDNYYFDLNKSIAYSDEGCKLVEPVDVLIRCASTFCANSTNSIASRFKRDLVELLNKITRTYSENSAYFIFDYYRNQTMAKVKTRISAGHQIQIRFQLEMGLLDATIDHLVSTAQFKSLAAVSEKHSTTHELFQAALTDIKKHPGPAALRATQSMTSKPAKRKVEAVSSIITRSKSAFKKTKPNNEDDEDKENQPGIRRAIGSSLRNSAKKNVLQVITNIAQSTHKTSAAQPPSTQAPEPSETEEKALNELKLVYVPRISFETCVAMMNIAICSPKSEKQFTCNHDALVSLMINSKFYDFVFDQVERKLDLLNETIMSSQTAMLQSADPLNLMASDAAVLSFLINTWKNMAHKIHGCTVKDLKISFQPNFAQRFNAAYLERSLRHLHDCRTIWKLVSRKWPNKRHELVFGTDSRQLSDYCWKFVLINCNSVSNHLNPSQGNRAIAGNCCAQMLNTIGDIIRSVKLPRANYENLLQWLTQLCPNSLSGQPEMLHALVDLMELMHERLTSPAVLIKHLAIELKVYAEDRSFGEEDADPYYIVNGFQYSLISTDNCLAYQKLVVEKAISYIDEMTKLISPLRYRHCPNKLTVFLADQIQMMLIAIHFFTDMIQNEVRAVASSLFELMANFVGYLERKSTNIDEDNIEHVKQVFSDKLLHDFTQSLPNIAEIAFYTQFQKSLKFLNLKI